MDQVNRALCLDTLHNGQTCQKASFEVHLCHCCTSLHPRKRCQRLQHVRNMQILFAVRGDHGCSSAFHQSRLLIISKQALYIYFRQALPDIHYPGKARQTHRSRPIIAACAAASPSSCCMDPWCCTRGKGPVHCDPEVNMYERPPSSLALQISVAITRFHQTMLLWPLLQLETDPLLPEAT